MLLDSNSRSVTWNSPGFSLMKALAQCHPLCSGYPKRGVTRNLWEGTAAISPSAASCCLPAQAAEGVAGCVWLRVKVISDPAAASGAWNSQGGKSSQSAQSWCSTALFKSKWIKAILDSLWFFFLIIFIAAILVQCFLTQSIEAHRTEVPRSRGGSGAAAGWITSTDLAPSHSKGVWGDGGAPELSVCAEQGCCSSAPSDFRGWTLVLQSHAWGSTESPLTGTAVLNVRTWVSIFQSPKPWVCLFYTSKPSPLLQRLLTPQSFIKEIKKGILLD